MNKSTAKNTIKKLDLFSLPFQFNLDNGSKKKKTLFGGLMSLSIVSISLTYLTYLCFLYFSNRIQPSISVSSLNDTSPYSMKFDSNFISAKITLPNGESLYDYQITQNKVYLSMIFTLDLYGIEHKITYYPLIPCTDLNLVGYMCLDIPSISEGSQEYQLYYNPNNYQMYNINIMYAYCQQKYLQNGQTCSSPQETDDLILNLSTHLNLRFNLTQYNTQTEEYESRIKQESFLFDNTLGFYTKFQLQKYDATVNKGFIVQNSSANTYFGNYMRVDNYLSQSFVSGKLGFDVLGATTFFIQSESTRLIYQFPQFTFVFAQFTSIFNTLLYLGFFCKLLAFSEIFHQVIELQLKNYYIKTRLFLLEHYGFHDALDKVKKEGVYSLWKYLQNIDLRDQVKQKIETNLLVRLKLLLFGSNKKQKYSEKKCDEKIILRSLHEISNKAINVFELQKEILQIKKMLQLILSVEQYAAIKLCGCSLPNYVDQQREIIKRKTTIFNEGNQQSQIPNQVSDPIILENEQIQLKPESKKPNEVSQQLQKIEMLPVEEFYSLNHLEQMDLIERDQNYFKTCVDKYLELPFRDSELDKRIMNCMIGFNQSDNPVNP